jgi:hypothetical protein
MGIQQAGLTVCCVAAAAAAASTTAVRCTPFTRSSFWTPEGLQV